MNKLEKLKHFNTIMQNVTVDEFDMSLWHCKTASCALGHACLDEKFIEQGLHLREDTTPDRYVNFAKPQYHGASDCRAGMEFFEIDDDEANDLFNDMSYPMQSADIMPHHVVSKIDRLIWREENECQTAQAT